MQSVDKRAVACLSLSVRFSPFFFCILQGVSVLELRSDHLHTAAECRDGVEQPGTTRGETFKQPASACPDTAEEGGRMENSSLGSGSVAANCEHGENGDDGVLSVGAPESDASLQEHGLGPPVDWVFPIPNAERDCLPTGDGVVEEKQHEEEEEKREEEREGEEEENQQSLGSTQRLSLRKTSEPAPSEAEGESRRVGILAPVVCGKQAEETDGGGVEAVKEGQGAAEGEETLPQEAANSATNRKEEEEEDTGLESAELITPIGDAEDSVMGQPLSLEGFDSERKEASQEGERLDSEGITLSLEPAEGLSAEKGLTECVSTPGDVPCTPLIDCGDVIEGPESAVPCLLIEGLREGEPPPDTNSLEQNQETAVRDYAIERQQGSAPETACHSGSRAEAASPEEPGGKRAAESCHTFESEHLPSVGGEECTSDGRPAADAEEEVGTEPSRGMTPSCGSEAADQDPEMTRSLSSEDDGSFRSIGSSTTDVFHPTRDGVSPEYQECPGGDAEECQSEEPEDHDQVSTASEGFPSEQADVATAAETDGGKGGTHSESQWSACLRTMEALTAEGTGEELEELDPRSNESPSMGPQSGGTAAHEVNETECAEAKDSNSDGELGPRESEVTARVCGDCPSAAEERGGEGDLQPGESVVASADASEDATEPERGDSKVTVEESRPHDEELRLPQSESDASPPPGSNVENGEPVEEPGAPEESCQNPHAAVDGASPGEIQGGQTPRCQRLLTDLLVFTHRRTDCGGDTFVILPVNLN